jgi:hypothetical protein
MYCQVLYNSGFVKLTGGQVLRSKEKKVVLNVFKYIKNKISEKCVVSE